MGLVRCIGVKQVLLSLSAARKVTLLTQVRFGMPDVSYAKNKITDPRATVDLYVWTHAGRFKLPLWNLF